MKPPSSGPPMVPIAMTEAVMPWYLPRSRGGTRAAMRAKAPAPMPPAPMPCSARKAISSDMDWAAPQIAEPAMNTVIETRYMGLRPNRSPNLPQIGVVTAVTRV
jgi:hypothetical protein